MRTYDGQIQAAENGTGRDTGNDWTVCADCGRPMYYDTADDNYHHALDAGEGCFLIRAENRMDDFDHPLLATDELVDVARAAWDDAKAHMTIDAGVDEADGWYGHCDTCGAPCDQEGCTVDRHHVVAIP